MKGNSLRNPTDSVHCHPGFLCGGWQLQDKADVWVAFALVSSSLNNMTGALEFLIGMKKTSCIEFRAEARRLSGVNTPVLLHSDSPWMPGLAFGLLQQRAVKHHRRRQAGDPAKAEPTGPADSPRNCIYRSKKVDVHKKIRCTGIIHITTYI